jgi:hypothetical protein
VVTVRVVVIDKVEVASRVVKSDVKDVSTRSSEKGCSACLLDENFERRMSHRDAPMLFLFIVYCSFPIPLR